MGAVAVGATIYFGSEESQAPDRGGLARPSRPPTSSAWPPCSGATCATRRSRRRTASDYHVAADLTGQANHLGVTIEADIIKQKLPENNGAGLPRPERSARPTSASTPSCMTDHPIDMTRYQVANCYMGRAGLINSGGASGRQRPRRRRRTAVINKRAGGTGLISGRKAFQRPMAEGVELLNAIQDVYLCDGGHGRVTDPPVLASEGWGVIHLLFRLRGRPPRGDLARRCRRARRGVHRRGSVPGVCTRTARRPRRPRADADRPGHGAPRALPRRLRAHPARPAPRAGARARARLDDRALRVHAARGQRGAHGDARAARAPAAAAQAPALLLPDVQEPRRAPTTGTRSTTTSAAS